MNDQNGRYTRIAGLASKPPADAHAHTAPANAAATKRPMSPVPDKTQPPPARVNQQPFLDAIQQLVDDSTVSATQGQAVDSEIQTLVRQVLGETKRSLAPAAAGARASTKEPPPPATRGSSGGKEPRTAAQAKSTPK